MKGGVVLALGVARTLAARPEAFAELSVLLVTDEEWRTAEFAHVQRFAGYDACLCFEAGQLTADGDEAVIVRRKAAGTLRVDAVGRAAHSGSAPDQGRNALLGLAGAAISVSRHHDPAGPQHLSVVPTVMRAGDAFNVVPAAGELLFDMRADGLEAFDARARGGSGRARRRRARGDARAPLAGHGLRRDDPPRCSNGPPPGSGRPIAGAARGGASDASHFAAAIPITVDGLGPRGGGAHTPQEFVLAPALRQRAEVALAVAAEVLDMNR